MDAESGKNWGSVGGAAAAEVASIYGLIRQYQAYQAAKLAIEEATIEAAELEPLGYGLSMIAGEEALACLTVGLGALATGAVLLPVAALAVAGGVGLYAAVHAAVGGDASLVESEGALARTLLPTSIVLLPISPFLSPPGYPPQMFARTAGAILEDIRGLMDPSRFMQGLDVANTMMDDSLQRDAQILYSYYTGTLAPPDQGGPSIGPQSAGRGGPDSAPSSRGDAPLTLQPGMGEFDQNPSFDYSFGSPSGGSYSDGPAGSLSMQMFTPVGSFESSGTPDGGFSDPIGSSPTESPDPPPPPPPVEISEPPGPTSSPGGYEPAPSPPVAAPAPIVDPGGDC